MMGVKMKKLLDLMYRAVVLFSMMNGMRVALIVFTITFSTYLFIRA
jgi:hypothetical protein